MPKQITIIPDGVLGYIPFEALLRKLPTNSTKFSEHAYLLNDYQISYAYSATLYKKMKNRQHTQTRKTLLAFAPSFVSQQLLANESRSISEVRGLLTDLKYNIPEVKAIQQLIGGDIFTDLAATKETFLNKATAYKILHLSTHGKADVIKGDYAYLAFTEVKDSIENNFLYNKDLYHMNIQADLVVLSACETGIGELQQGEGIISLARGFSYAGAKSVITTLWSVDDQKTMNIMKQFYSFIKDGAPKDQALRQAKLNFLEDYGNLAHPFFWAPFVPIGDMSPMKFTPMIFNQSYLLKTSLLLLVLLLVFLSIRRFR